MAQYSRSILLLVCLVTVLSLSDARHDNVLKSLIHTAKTVPMPRRIYVPTVSYVAPPPYEPIPRFLTEPYSSKGFYRSFKMTFPSSSYYPNTY